MIKETNLKIECCDIYNKLKDKSEMIDYLYISKVHIKELTAQLAVMKKALELACDYLVSNGDDELYYSIINIYDDDEYLTAKINYFITKAKEILKDE